jgi:hypothetical protein
MKEAMKMRTTAGDGKGGMTVGEFIGIHGDDVVLAAVKGGKDDGKALAWLHTSIGRPRLHANVGYEEAPGVGKASVRVFDLDPAQGVREFAVFVLQKVHLYVFHEVGHPFGSKVTRRDVRAAEDWHSWHVRLHRAISAAMRRPAGGRKAGGRRAGKAGSPPRPPLEDGSRRRTVS